MTKDKIVERKAFDLAPMEVGIEEVRDLVISNVGDDGISQFDLERAINPTSGNTEWKIPSIEGEPEKTSILEGVIVYHRSVRAYWPGEFKPDAGPPQCSSFDGRTGEGNPGGSCADCPFAVFGSGKNNSQDCNAVKQLFIIRPGELLPTLVNISAMNIGAPKRYLLALLSKKRLKFNAVVTRIELHDDKSTSGYDYARTDFTMVQKLDSDQFQAMEQLTEMFTPMLSQAPVTIDVTPEETTGDHKIMDDPVEEPEF